MSTISFKLEGQWDKGGYLISQLSRNLKESTDKAEKELAQKLYAIVTDHLRNQDIPGWTPLSEKYAAKKQSEWNTADILIRSREYYASIKWWKDEGRYYVGVKKGETYVDGTEISRIANIHETWSSMPGRPYRPLWSYSWNEMAKSKETRQTVIMAIFKEMSKKGYPIKLI